MALNTNFFPGDQEPQMLAKLLILFGGSPTGGDGRPQLLRKILQAANGASEESATLLNFQDSADDADAIVYHTGGTVESLRVVGSTGHIKLADSTARRIYMSGDDNAVAIIGGTGKSTGAFVEIYGQDHASGPGHVTVSLHHQGDGTGNFRVRSAARDSAVSVIRLEVVGDDGECRLVPSWTDAGTSFIGLNVNAYSTGYAAGTKLATFQINDVESSSIGVDGAYSIGGDQIITARQTGWTAATGTATRTTFDTVTVSTELLAQRVKALLDDLIAHGLIGA